jgi:hypothetical protein
MTSQTEIGKSPRRNVLKEKALRTKLLGGKWLRRSVLVREGAEDKGRRDESICRKFYDIWDVVWFVAHKLWF